jgi:hypothetical protein
MAQQQSSSKILAVKHSCDREAPQQRTPFDGMVDELLL